jgi:peroxiredoxin
MSSAPGLDVGADAPAFTAPLVHPDGRTEDVSLSALLENGPVLLVFYTNDFSPDCIEEWCSFRDFGWFSRGEGVQVVGISKSGSYLHRRFIDYLDLEFPLYSDRDLEVAKRFEVDYRAVKLFPRARRSCFLVDTDGIVKYRWLGEHWLDPTRDTPPVAEIHEAIVDVLDGEEGSEERVERPGETDETGGTGDGVDDSAGDDAAEGGTGDGYGFGSPVEVGTPGTPGTLDTSGSSDAPNGPSGPGDGGDRR